MMQSSRFSWSRPLAAALLILGLCHAAAAQTKTAELRDAGREVAKKYEMAVVNIQVVVTTQDGNDHKMEGSGTVIGPDGLTIVPLNNIDPMSVARRMRGDSEGGQGNTRVKEIKLLVNKRNEVPATEVLRDEDLNIALLRPTKKPATPMTYVNLDNAADASLLEQVFVLARMGRVADREIGAMTGEIQSVVSKPRKFYIPSAELASGGYGVPIFDAQGKTVGIILIRINGSTQDNDVVAIVLPTKDIKEFAAQAPAEAPKHIPVAGAPEPPAKIPVKTMGDTKTK